MCTHMICFLGEIRKMFICIPSFLEKYIFPENRIAFQTQMKWQTIVKKMQYYYKVIVSELLLAAG